MYIFNLYELSCVFYKSITGNIKTINIFAYQGCKWKDETKYQNT